MVNGRRKGHQYERDTANKLRHLFPDIKRHLEYQGVDVGYDLENTGNLKIQCKRGRNYAPVNKIEEAPRNGIPVLITKGDRKEDVAVLYLEDFIKILSDIGVVYGG